MSLADNLLYLRKEKNLSQEKLAEELKVSRQAIGKWESDNDPELSHVKAMCEYFNVNMHIFVCGDVSEPAITISKEPTISVGNPDTPTIPLVIPKFPKKNRARQYRAIRSTVASMLFLVIILWRFPANLVGKIIFIIMVGLFIYNRSVKYKLTEDILNEDSNSKNQQSIWHHTGIKRFFSGNRKWRGIWPDWAKRRRKNYTDENSRNLGTPDDGNGISG